jgi:carotenoid cleavage dioxygenase-like enzyme
MTRFSIVILLYTALTLSHSYFLNIRFGNPFKISDREIKKTIDYKSLSNFDKRLIKKLNGFYGVVGPDINKTEVKTLYDLFTGNGNVQGIFFDNGEITYVKHFIRTEKLIYEECHGKIQHNNLFLTAILMAFNKINIFPNILGVANTALLEINNKVYALFEQDSPYLLEIDNENKAIKTIKKHNIPDIPHFSGHSKFNTKLNTIDTIDYNAVTNKATYHQLTGDFKSIKKLGINTKYMPLVHDFVSLPNSILFCDSPLMFDLKYKKIPVTFHKNRDTFFHIVDKETLSKQTFSIEESFYIFHYAECKEYKNAIEIYASLYENIDYETIDIKGKYRKITINKENKKILIEKNPLLEKYNLEFPVEFENNQILLRNDNNAINGFVVCNGLRIIKNFYLKDLYIAGEPKVIYIEKIPYFISFSYSSKTDKGFFLLVNLRNYVTTTIPLNESINIGFHSIFIK